MFFQKLTFKSSSLFVIEFPRLTAHWAELLIQLRVEPLDDAMDVENVLAVTPDEWAVVARQRAVGTAGFKGHSADTAVVVVSNPSPDTDSGPTCND